jgi:transcriptional regulator with XRE-family HTH domain
MPSRLRATGRCLQALLPKPGQARFHRAVDQPDTLAVTLQRVGPRLREIRETRHLTLADLAARTRISKSTLSRLETGQRRPTLELLLQLAQTYRVPLDDLVGAPDTGDPRIRLRPRRVHGRTVVPLTQGPAGVQAWKMLLPPGNPPAELRRHHGHEWLYVLSGRMRLLLGDQDLVLGVGEAIEFDTAEPHWFGSADDQPAEVLSLFGRPGEQMRVRHGGAAREPRVPAQRPGTAASRH